MTTFADYEMQWYINRGILTGTLKDRERAWYIVALGGAPALETLTTDDLEMFALQNVIPSTTIDLDDLWFEFLDPVFGPGLTVRDLRYEMYKLG